MPVGKQTKFAPEGLFFGANPVVPIVCGLGILFA
jgi:hypothetical protein